MTENIPELQVRDPHPESDEVIMPFAEFLKRLDEAGARIARLPLLIEAMPVANRGELAGNLDRAFQESGSLEPVPVTPELWESVRRGTDEFGMVTFIHQASGIEFGTFDSGFHFVRGPLRLLRALAERFDAARVVMVPAAAAGLEARPPRHAGRADPLDGTLMREIETLSFVDVEERQDALAIVRCGPGTVAVTLSLLDGSDTECFMPVEVAERLQRALAAAVEAARES